MVVDDDRDWQLQFKHLLTAAGFEVNVAADIRMARRIVTQFHPDAVLMDMCLTPRDDNYDDFTLLCHVLRRECPAALLIATSSRPIDPTFMWSLREHGISAFASKDGISGVTLATLVEPPTAHNRINSPLDVKILVVAAAPNETGRLRLDRECKGIKDALKQAPNAERFNVETELATTPDALTQTMLKFEPEILHFAGHGEPNGGILLEDQTGGRVPVSAPVLVELLAQFESSLRCVVLNSCYSGRQAQAISRYADVVGIRGVVKDEASIAFAVGFYQALGAGRPFHEAYKLGRWLGILQQADLDSVLINKKVPNSARKRP